eukprot:TRINITY_DN12033_c0_g1_i1.p1 TRINITY_DN12033_c0_g1~~TRINITY_DN12033_c0_g1_i1.p1  ORF type:complete len:390 (+),score=100.85 TRINITY_DN12033_c0_g1_i1:37-1206(+)
MALFLRRPCIGLDQTNSMVLYRKLKDGSRFGPKLATDGGRIFQSSSRDIENVIKKKKLTEEQIEEYYQRGILTQWIESPKRIRGRKYVEADAVSGWKRGDSRRVGVIGKKIGMRREVDMWGQVHPVTVVQLQNNQVLQVKTKEDHQKEVDYYTLQVGAGLKKWHNLTKPEIGHLAKVDADPKAIIMEFPVSKDAVLPPGTLIPATHFVPGQYLDVKGTTKGKGYQGAMKKWGFAGGPASHGSSKFHRGLGSTAAGKTDPARVWPGKKMPGRMGSDVRTTYCLQLLKINTEDHLLYIRGSIPGPAGSWVQVFDSIKKLHRIPPPFPTHLPDQQPYRPAPKRKYLRMVMRDPFTKSRTVDWESKWRSALVALRSAQAGEEGEDDGGDDASD